MIVYKYPKLRKIASNLLTLKKLPTNSNHFTQLTNTVWVLNNRTRVVFIQWMKFQTCNTRVQKKICLVNIIQPSTNPERYRKSSNHPRSQLRLRTMVNLKHRVQEHRILRGNNSWLDNSLRVRLLSWGWFTSMRKFLIRIWSSPKIYWKLE